MTYFKEAFSVYDLDQAKNVALSADSANPNKFFRETKFFVDAIDNEKIICQKSLVLDFGCGMGRVSKALILRFGCRVVGVDSSLTMRHFSRKYVDSKIFHTLDTEDLCKISKFNVCLAAFVLQHVEDPAKEIKNIFDVLKPGGYFVVLNEKKRFVPVGGQQFVEWRDDGIDVFAEIEKLFVKRKEVPYINPDLSIVFYQKEASDGHQ